MVHERDRARARIDPRRRVVVLAVPRARVARRRGAVAADGHYDAVHPGPAHRVARVGQHDLPVRRGRPVRAALVARRAGRQPGRGGAVEQPRRRVGARAARRRPADGEHEVVAVRRRAHRRRVVGEGRAHDTPVRVRARRAARRRLGANDPAVVHEEDERALRGDLRRKELPRPAHTQRPPAPRGRGGVDVAEVRHVVVVSQARHAAVSAPPAGVAGARPVAAAHAEERAVVVRCAEAARTTGNRGGQQDKVVGRRGGGSGGDSGSSAELLGEPHARLKTTERKAKF